jgi:hypothetical protein
MSFARRICCFLIRHAGRVVPEGRSDWATAMAHETHHIDNDREALSWAFGCVIAAYAANLRSEECLPWAVRLILAGWCLIAPLAFFYHASLFALCPAVSGPECMASINSWSFALHATANGLYLLAAWRLLANRRGVFVPYAAGFLLLMADELRIELASDRGAVFFTLRRVYDFTMSDLGNFRMPGGHANVEIILTVLILPLMLGLAIWLMDRYPVADHKRPASTS